MNDCSVTSSKHSHHEQNLFTYPPNPVKFQAPKNTVKFQAVKFLNFFLFEEPKVCALNHTHLQTLFVVCYKGKDIYLHNATKP
jgi:hypothetical protein